jgi:hypothetical protein
MIERSRAKQQSRQPCRKPAALPGRETMPFFGSGIVWIIELAGEI